MKIVLILLTAVTLSTKAAQLVSTNSPPSVTCPTNTTAECGTLFTAVAIVSDPDGDAVTVVWSVNGLSLQTNTVAAGVSSANLSFQAILPLGTNVVTVTATDSVGNSTSCS